MKQIERNLRAIFKEYPKLKSLKNTKMLIWYYWTKCDDIETTIDFSEFQGLTNPETITRSRRAILNEEGEKDPQSDKQEQAYLNYYA